MERGLWEKMKGGEGSQTVREGVPQYRTGGLRDSRSPAKAESHMRKAPSEMSALESYGNLCRVVALLPHHPGVWGGNEGPPQLIRWVVFFPRHTHTRSVGEPAEGSFTNYHVHWT